MNKNKFEFLQYSQEELEDTVKFSECIYFTVEQAIVDLNQLMSLTYNLGLKNKKLYDMFKDVLNRLNTLNKYIEKVNKSDHESLINKVQRAIDKGGNDDTQYEIERDKVDILLDEFKIIKETKQL